MGVRKFGNQITDAFRNVHGVALKTLKKERLNFRSAAPVHEPTLPRTGATQIVISAEGREVPR
jgi:hypothetical protein